MNKKPNDPHQINVQIREKSERVSSAKADKLLRKAGTPQSELEMKNEEMRCVLNALEASRDHYLQLYELAPVAYLTLTENGLIAEANLTAASWLGVERKKLIKRSFANFIAPEEAEAWQSYLLNVKQQTGKYNYELKLRSNDGGYCPALISSVMQRDENDAAFASIRMAIHMTESKQLEESLRNNEAFFHAVLDSVAPEIAVLNHDGVIVAINESWRLFALENSLYSENTRSQIGVGANYLEICLIGSGFSEDTARKAHDGIYSVLEGRLSSFNLEYCCNAAEKQRWFSMSVTCLDSGFQGAVLTYFDITERKQAEAELRVAAVAFETQAGIIVTDAKKRILRVNQAFSRITGNSCEDVKGLSPSFLRSGIHDKDFYQVMWSTVKKNDYWQGEIWDKRENGEIFPLWLTISAVTNAEGSITHYVGSFTDMTAQKKAEKILLESRERLENQVATTQVELKKIKEEALAVNTALDVLLKHQKTDTDDAQCVLLMEMEATVFPFLKKLKGSNIDKTQMCLLDILETNLMDLVKSYGRTSSLPSAYQHLTPVEIQVASMVRQGLSTKVIAATLNLAPGTVCIHRKHIRKKLGLDSKASNLYSYLMSLTE